MRPFVGHWQIGLRCVACKDEMSWHTMMYSYGVCPHCGAKVGSPTIVECDEFSFRWRRDTWFGKKRREVKS